MLGGIVPLVHSASPRLIESEWGFVLLAIGAGSVLFDRVFGHSSSWTRFTRTGLALQHALVQAQTEWFSILLSLGSEQSEEELRAFLSDIEGLHTKVQHLMEEETSAWVGYLADSLEELAFTTTARNAPVAAGDAAQATAMPGPRQADTSAS